MRTSKVKDQQSIETKIFKVLKEIGVELSSYHGGILNGKDIRKVMTNACYIFDTFATIFKAGKRPNCMLSDANINALCMQFCEVFVLWDGAFSLARTINPTEIDCSTYRMYVRAAVKSSKDLQCTVTPKVHLMLEHVEWQMTNIRGGVRRQNGRLGGAAAPRWEAKATALLHSTEPHRSCARQRESALKQYAPRCDFSDQQNK
jgi:hypothetical protein